MLNISCQYENLRPCLPFCFYGNTGDISQLKEQYKKNTEDYMKTQDLNKARMEQCLQAKLAARRHKKTT